jgi:Na+-translocating ferredoxin:NAD+ oxidoreductase RnfC subunit
VDDNYHAVPRVVLPLGSAEPVVAEGQKVVLGDLVAQPMGVGTRVHSPIAGRVHRVAPDRIEIRRE